LLPRSTTRSPTIFEDRVQIQRLHVFSRAAHRIPADAQAGGLIDAAAVAREIAALSEAMPAIAEQSFLAQ
jgi:hypothetical protein